MRVTKVKSKLISKKEICVGWLLVLEWMFLFSSMLFFSFACVILFSNFDFAALEQLYNNIKAVCAITQSSGKNTSIAPYFETLKVGLHTFLISRSSSSHRRSIKYGIKEMFLRVELQRFLLFIKFIHFLYFVCKCTFINLIHIIADFTKYQYLLDLFVYEIN